QEYKREAFQLFEQLLGAVKLEFVQTLARIQVQSQEEVAAMEAQRQAEADAMALQFQHADADAPGAAGELPEGMVAGEMQPPAAVPETFVRPGEKVGRNDPCPCGSGKKFKHCHGSLV
ncbi:MAG: SEC-C metal-binding domain-containing protein, partial [Moraxellaceae bacterium]|nr:SEC-C metal-binding domain-containing protein [Moraxellaceae bacterium]